MSTSQIVQGPICPGLTLPIHFVFPRHVVSPTVQRPAYKVHTLLIATPTDTIAGRIRSQTPCYTGRGPSFHQDPSPRTLPLQRSARIPLNYHRGWRDNLSDPRVVLYVKCNHNLYSINKIWIEICTHSRIYKFGCSHVNAILH